MNFCSVPCTIEPAAKKEFIEEIKQIIKPKNNDSQNNFTKLEDLNMKEIQKEQF